MAMQAAVLESKRAGEEGGGHRGTAVTYRHPARIPSRDAQSCRGAARSPLSVAPPLARLCTGARRDGGSPLKAQSNRHPSRGAPGAGDGAEEPGSRGAGPAEEPLLPSWSGGQIQEKAAVISHSTRQGSQTRNLLGAPGLRKACGTQRELPFSLRSSAGGSVAPLLPLFSYTLSPAAKNE